MMNPNAAVGVGWNASNNFNGDSTNLRGAPAGFVASMIVRPSYDTDTTSGLRTLGGHWDPASTSGYRFIMENAGTLGFALGFDAYDSTNSLVRVLWEPEQPPSVSGGKLYMVSARVEAGGVLGFYINGVRILTNTFGNNFQPAGANINFALGANPDTTESTIPLWGIGGFGIKNSLDVGVGNDEEAICGYVWQQTQLAGDLSPVVPRDTTFSTTPVGTSYYDVMYSAKRGIPLMGVVDPATGVQGTVVWDASVGTAQMGAVGTHDSRFRTDSVGTVWGEVAQSTPPS